MRLMINQWGRANSVTRSAAETIKGRLLRRGEIEITVRCESVYTHYLRHFSLQAAVFLLRFDENDQLNRLSDKLVLWRNAGFLDETA